jgi:hypothetical protein
MCSDGTCLAKVFYKHETAGLTVALIQSSDQKPDRPKNALLPKK